MRVVGTGRVDMVDRCQVFVRSYGCAASFVNARGFCF